MKQRLPLFLFSLCHMVEARNSAVQSFHFFSSPCVTWWKPETVLYRASTFSLLLVSHGGSQKQCCTELPLFLFSLCHMVEARNSAVQGFQFFSSPCVTWWKPEPALYRASTFSLLLVSLGGSQKQCCTELPLFLFSLCHMVKLVHVDSLSIF